MKFLVQKFFLYCLAAIGALVINFFLPRLLPGDPASMIFARFQGRLDPAVIGDLKATFGLVDKPLFEQFLTYLSSLMHGDFGLSIAYFPAKVTDVIAQGLLWTVFLTGVTVLLSFSLGTILGAFAAWNRRSVLDRYLPPLLTLLGSFPYFWLAMAMVFVFAFTLGWMPLGHGYDQALEPQWSWTFVISVLQHSFLPALSILLATVGGWMLGMRNAMISVLGSDYIALAKAKGLSPHRILWHYAVRNAILPNLTGFGMALGFILSGSLLTEIIFSYPGQGYLLVQAVRNQDYPLMQGLFLCITFSVLVANWMVDIVTYYLDPKTREAS